MADHRMRIAYVHGSPLHDLFESKYDDPTHLAEIGFTDVVVADQLSGSLHVEPAELLERITPMREAGLKVWLMDDLFTLRVDSTAGCPGQEATWEETAAAIRSLLEALPEVRGMVFRFGETFVHPDAGIRRQDLLGCDCIDCGHLDGIERRRKVLAFLEAVVCREMGRRCILRLWDLGEDGAHADRRVQAAVLSAWAGDPRLLVSVKHTMTDYWRHQPWNPTLGVEGPARILEFQCEREYEFIGMLPNWQGPEWSQGPIECGEHTWTGLANNPPEDWAGSWVLPLGGGWAKRRATSTLWADMNVHAALALTEDPDRDAGEILREWMLKEDIPPEAEDLLTRSAELILRLRYLDVWRLIADQRWMPAENWFRDDNFVPGACASIASTVQAHGMADLLRSERALASAMARRQRMEAGEIDWGEHRDFVLESYVWAVAFAEWTESVWGRLLEAAPLSRAEAKAILIEARPPSPLSVMA